MQTNTPTHRRAAREPTPPQRPRPRSGGHSSAARSRGWSSTRPSPGASAGARSAFGSGARPSHPQTLQRLTHTFLHTLAIVADFLRLRARAPMRPCTCAPEQADAASPDASVAQFFGIGTASRCRDPEMTARRNIWASLAYHADQAHRRHSGAQLHVDNGYRALATKGAVAGETAPKRCGHRLHTLARGGPNPPRPRATPATGGRWPPDAAAARTQRAGV